MSVKYSIIWLGTKCTLVVQRDERDLPRVWLNTVNVQ